MFALMVMNTVMSTDMHIHTTVYARKAAAAVSHMIRKKKTLHFLTYMLQHNEHHAAELDQMADKLRKAGMDTAAEQIRKAVDEFQKGNLYLSVALATVKEN